MFLLKALGFYNRPVLFSRRETAWVLSHAVTLAVLGLVTVLFLRKQELARAVIFLFGGFAFLLVMVKEELVLSWMQSKLGQEQLRRRVVLVGMAEDTAQIERDLETKARGVVEVLARLDLHETSGEKLIELLHDRAANGVILSARHTYFEQVEKVIELCELEGVEVWLLADFFKTRVSQTSVDDFLGRPTVVFRSAPEASWRGWPSRRWTSSAHWCCCCWRPRFPVGGTCGEAHFLRSGAVSAAAQRAQWPAVYDAQVPHHGDGCGAVEGRVGIVQRNGRPGLQGHQ